MLIPIALLTLFMRRTYFESYYKYVNVKVIPSQTALLLRDYKKYYILYPNKETIELEEFIMLFQQQWHLKNLNEEQHATFQLIFNNLGKSSMSSIEDVLLPLFSSEAQVQILDCVAKEFNEDTIKGILEIYDKKRKLIGQSLDTEAVTFENVSFGELQKTTGFAWSLSGLQNKCGNLVCGNFILVVAYIGCGKTAFCISQAVAVFKQLHERKEKRPILYFDSEGGPRDVWAKFITCALSQGIDPVLRPTFEEIIHHEEEFRKKFAGQFDTSLFRVYDVSGQPIDWVLKYIKIHNPALIIIDMIDDLSKGQKQHDILNNTALYQSVRKIAGEMCPVIATVQSKGSVRYYDAEQRRHVDKKYLDLQDIDFSNVHKQQKAETVIAVGMCEDYPRERYINVCKIKRGTTGRLSPVKISPMNCLFEDLELKEMK